MAFQNNNMRYLYRFGMGSIMKNSKKAAFAVLAAAALLAACSGRPDTVVTSEEIVVPQMSSEDLIVSSLKYLLEEDGAQEAEVQSGEQKAAPEQPEGMPGQEESALELTEPEAQDREEEMRQEIVIYYGNGGASELTRESVAVDEITPDSLIDALARHNIVTLLDTKVLSFAEKEQEDGKILQLDLSGAFGEYLRTMSEEAECIIIASLANTFLENYDAEAIGITVEGKPLSTSNAEYPQTFVRCTPEEVKALMGQGGAEDSTGFDS